MGSGASSIKSASNINFLAENSVIWEGGSDRFLSRELLNEINQKTGGSIGVMGGLGGIPSPAAEDAIHRRRSFSKNTKFTMEKENELPHRTQVFLKNIGISVDGSSPNRKSTRLSHNEQKTKLVSHVFDCLGALEELVALDKQFSTNELQSVNETQSMCDRNTNSVGKLVHELVSIYGLCGDSLQVLVESQPEAAAVEDAAGRMALHVAVDKNQPWIRLVNTLVDAYPTACKMRDGGGRLPLHIAVDRNNPSVEVIRALIRGYPEAAEKHRGVGRLPLHYAVFYDEPSVDVVAFLLEVYPGGASMPDVYGRLPLHYAVDRPRPNATVVQILLAAHPEASRMRDTTANLPLSIALNHGGLRSVEVVKMLLDSFPESITELDSEGRMPLHSVLHLHNPDVGVARYLARQYPEAITQTCGEGQDSPLRLCEKNGFPVIQRSLLSLRPDLFPATLRELNWAARRAAVLMSVPRPQLPKKPSERKEEAFAIAPSASSARLSSNIVTNSLTDDLNIMSAESDLRPELQPEKRASTAQRQRERENGPFCNDIEWILEDKKCFALQKFMIKLFDEEPKLWRRTILFL